MRFESIEPAYSVSIPVRLHPALAVAASKLHVIETKSPPAGRGKYVVTTVNGMPRTRTASGRKAFIVIVLLLVVLGGLWLARRSAAPPPAKSEGAAVEAPLELAPADVARVAMMPLARSLPLSGSVQPVTQTTIKSKVSGEVLRLVVREGEAVKRGMVMAQIDTRNAGPTRDNAAAALEKSRADLAIAKLNYENSAKLLEQKFVSQNAVDSAKAVYDAAIASEKSAAANLRLAAVALEDTAVTAPFDGVVSKRLVEVGEKVSPDTAMFSLVDLSQMELDAPAPTADIPQVKLGQTARFHVDGFGDRAFTGTVWRINPVAESGSRSIMIYLSVPNADGALKGGMFAQGELVLDAGAPVPAIPRGGVHSDAGESYVWVVIDGKVERRPVKPGLSAPDVGMIEIREGLKPGEQVVVARIETLKPGKAVRLPAAESAPAAPLATPTSGS